jgi:HSP20 family protein
MTASSRFDPIKQELTNIRDQVAKALEDTFSMGSNSLPLDVYETPTSVVIVTGALLGLDTHSLDISITEGHEVTITGETHAPDDVPAEKYLRRERKFGKFSRTFNLPIAVLAEEAKASFKHNLLTITIPKVEQSNPKVVKITPSE